MGLAKYYEDNLEIIYERLENINDLFMRSTIQMKNTSPSASKVVVTISNNFEPISKPKLYHDRFLICRDCGRVFVFTAKAQEHYAKKGWCTPKRCKACRDLRTIQHLMVS